MQKIYFLLLFIAACYGWSCKKQSDESSSIDVGYNYFPVNVGHELVYDVDSIVYDDNTGSTTITPYSYQYKEVIAATIIDDIGREAQRVDRFFRQNDTSPWQVANSWIVSRDNVSVQKVQENTRYVKLLFPLKQNKVWDGNIYNGKGEEDYSIQYLDQPYELNGVTYSKTAKILQVDDINAIEEIRRHEIYARNIGMIYFQSDSINTQRKDSPAVGTKSRGYRYHLTLKSYQ
jgi:hypothetical protein